MQQQPLENPLDSFNQGLQMALGIGAAKQQLGAIRQQQAMEQQKNALMQKIASHDATADDYSRLMVLSNKDEAEKLQGIMRSQDIEKAKDSVQSSAQAIFALKSGNINNAIEMMQRRRDVYRERGDVDAANMLDSVIESAKIDPKATSDYMSGILSLMPGGKDVLGNILELTKSQREAAKDRAQIGLVEANTRRTNVESSILPQELALKQMEANSGANVDLFEAEKKRNEILESQLRQGKLGAEINEKQLDLETKQNANTQAKALKRSFIDSSLEDVGFLLGLKSKKSLDRVLGPIDGKSPITLRQDSADIENRIDSLIGRLSFDNLDGLKGAVSDNDIAFLKSVSTRLNKTMSPQAFNTELEKLKNFLNTRKKLLNTNPENASNTRGSKGNNVEFDY